MTTIVVGKGQVVTDTKVTGEAKKLTQLQWEELKQEGTELYGAEMFQTFLRSGMFTEEDDGILFNFNGLDTTNGKTVKLSNGDIVAVAGNANVLAFAQQLNREGNFSIEKVIEFAKVGFDKSNLNRKLFAASGVPEDMVIATLKLMSQAQVAVANKHHTVVYDVCHLDKEVVVKMTTFGPTMRAIIGSGMMAVCPEFLAKAQGMVNMKTIDEVLKLQLTMVGCCVPENMTTEEVMAKAAQMDAMTNNEVRIIELH